jgi:hypothetical protein
MGVDHLGQTSISNPASTPIPLSTREWKSLDSAIKGEGWEVYGRPEHASMIMEVQPIFLSVPLTGRLLNKARKAIGWKSTVPEYEAEAFDPKILKAEYDDTAHHVRMYSRRIEDRWRPPIRFATGSLVLGFVCQLVGSWPC